MSTCVITIPTAPNLQHSLNNAFVQEDLSAQGTPSGLLDFITSPANTSGLAQEVSKNGKVYTVNLTASPRIPLSQVSSDATQKCTSVEQFGENVFPFTLDPAVGASVDFVVDVAELVRNNESTDTWLNKILASMISALERKMALDAATQLSTQYGAFRAGDTNQDGTPIVGNIKTLSSQIVGGAPDYRFISSIQFSTIAAQYTNNRAMLFGWDFAYQAFMALNSGCCADSGIDLYAQAQKSGLAFMADANVGEVFGGDALLSMAVGATQLLSYNKFEGDGNIKMTETYSQYVIVSPRSGISYDLMIKFDCGKYYLQLSKAYKFVTLPSNYCAGDPLEGVNMVNLYTIANPV